MASQRTLESQARKRERVRAILQGAGVALLLALASVSAVVVKRTQSSAPGLPLAALDVRGDAGPLHPPEAPFDPTYLPLPVEDPLVEGIASTSSPAPEVTEIAEVSELPAEDSFPAETRWFDGRPLRPARTILMTVTGYSPGEESCGDSADGITSSLHSVWTNGMKLVAADTRVLPLGSVISVPGYHSNQLVPVLDRGGKIKGNRLDLLYPTAQQALNWGVKKVRITVWEYADGKPAPDWRKIRDSKH